VHIIHEEIDMFVTHLCTNFKSDDLSFIISTPTPSFNHQVIIYSFSNLNSGCILSDNVFCSMLQHYRPYSEWE